MAELGRKVGAELALRKVANQLARCARRATQRFVVNRSYTCVQTVACERGRLYHSEVPDDTVTSRTRVLVLGVGNTMKGDDGVGPYVAAWLAERGGHRETIQAIDCGTTPENYTSLVRRLSPGLLVIVDAAEMGLEAGACRIIPQERAGALGLSTHSMPLSLFVTYVSDLAARIVIVGIQPRSMGFGGALSPEVEETGQSLVSMLARGTLTGIAVLD